MFVCDLCGQNSKPGERMLKVPDKVTPASPTSGPQIKKEARLCPTCGKCYVDALKTAAPHLNPQSVYAALVE